MPLTTRPWRSWAQPSSPSEVGGEVSASHMVYVASRMEEFLLSKEACRSLGIVGEEFHRVGAYLGSSSTSSSPLTRYVRGQSLEILGSPSLGSDTDVSITSSGTNLIYPNYDADDDTDATVRDVLGQLEQHQHDVKAKGGCGAILHSGGRCAPQVSKSGGERKPGGDS